MSRIFLIAGVFAFLIFLGFGVPAQDFTALLLPETITPENLKSKYDNKNLKILIIPGHNNKSRAGNLKTSANLI